MTRRGASRWVAELPAGADRDTAVNRMAWAGARDDPVQALRWGLTIEDATKRASAVGESFFNG
ncbi:MAG: hypothetical protein ACOYMN_10770 [Roseimicrobium sp.]